MKRTEFLTCFVLVTAMIVFAAPSLAEEPVVSLWNGQAPGQSMTGEPETVEGGRISHVNDPTLTVYLPPAGKATGQAVIVCPGGGYGYLAIGYEGHDVARWFNTLGVASFVLKYRLFDYGQPAPLQDAQRAIRLVRSRAAEYGIDPGRIGIMGFSAGGHVATTAATHFNDAVYPSVDEADTLSARPDFLIAIYPVVSMQTGLTHTGSRKNLLGSNPSPELIELYSNELQVTAETSPSFLVHGTDDKVVPVGNSLRFYSALVDSGVPAELHCFREGKHGFGLGRGKGAVSDWPALCADWLQGLQSE